MILFRDILKEAYGKLAQESDYIDADFVGTEGEISSGEDLKEKPDVKEEMQRPIPKPVK